MTGPLAGIKVVEMAGIGPGPFCAMMLADMGAEVICIDRKVPGLIGGGGTVVDRGRRSIVLDIKDPDAVEVVLKIVERSDVLIEGMRPGVMERLGLGPDPCLQRNPRLVYGRMTGWGQTGPLAHTAGHDLNYVAITGALNAMGYSDRPPSPPLHLVGDMGGGAMMLAFGIAAALVERNRSGKGQVIDSAISDGVAVLSTMYYAMQKTGMWSLQRGSNMLDGGAHFYGCYECADGKYVSIGAIEPQFYELLMKKCAIEDAAFKKQWEQKEWPTLRSKLEAIFRTRSCREWCELLEGTDACFAPVLNFEEAQKHPHNLARKTFIELNGFTQPAPAPRFSRTPAEPGTIAHPGQHTVEILQELGLSEKEIESLRS